MTFERKYRDISSEPPVELTPIGEKCFQGGDVIKCKVYNRRWLILLIFTLFNIVSTSQWTQYAIINNIIIRYYHVESVYVEWTAIIFMAVYAPAIIPALMFLEKKVCTYCYLQMSC
jgi:FLVCR family feline leukemia virus subgroup C receptor-related protein